MLPTRVTTAGALIALSLAACGGTPKHPSAAGSFVAPPDSSASTAAVTSTTGVVPAGATTPVSSEASHRAAHLVAVRAARQQGLDRVVFEFQAQAPGYRIAYATSPVMNTEGREVAVPGAAKLVVHLEQATGADTYTGPASVTPQGTTQVEELARVEDFEAVLSWVVGVRTKVPFRVTTLASPPRLVID